MANYQISIKSAAPGTYEDCIYCTSCSKCFNPIFVIPEVVDADFGFPQLERIIIDAIAAAHSCEYETLYVSYDCITDDSKYNPGMCDVGLIYQYKWYGKYTDGKWVWRANGAE